MSNKIKDIPANIGEYLRYEPDTGHFYWIKKTSPKSRKRAGDRAGVLRQSGYRYIGLKGKVYAEHRIAWFFHYGEQPREHVHHANEIKDDNRICNLEDVTHGHNMIHRCDIAKESDLPKCVYPNGKRFRAKVQRDKKENYIGTYDTPEEAHQAALDWLEQYNKTQD